MRLERRDDVVVYKDQEKRIKTRGWWCSACDEAIFDGKALAAREAAFLEHKAEIDGVLGPKEVTAIREKLGLSQRAASELLGGGPRSFQKYESGTQAVSVPMSNLLRLLSRDPSRLEELRQSAHKPLSKASASKGATSKPAAKRRQRDKAVGAGG